MEHVICTFILSSEEEEKLPMARTLRARNGDASRSPLLAPDLPDNRKRLPSVALHAFSDLGLVASLKLEWLIGICS
jgi:hypothetical protein